jgi:hypothetical protein
MRKENSMLEWFIEQKDWIFSGIGIVIISFSITFVRKMKFSSLGNFMSRVYGVFISFLRSDEDITKNINIDLRPRNSPFEIYLDDLPKSKFWLRGLNFNPFEISIKHITIEYSYGGMTAKCSSFLHGCTLPKLSINDVILVDDGISSEQADYIAGFQDESRCTVIIKAVLKTPSKEISYESNYLEGISPALINKKLRSEKMLIN